MPQQEIPRFAESGILNVFKPVGMTSHDLVYYVRRALGRAKTGHAGTLDPAACGVLVVLLNKATKLASAATILEKHYRAEMTFGIRTDTGDAQGMAVEERAVSVEPDALRAAMKKFTGKISQVPPMTSAIKIGGKKLYKLAHRGEEIERPPRQVTIHALELVDFDPAQKFPRAVLDIRCSSGTYVRTLVEDIAAEMGLPAFTSFLIRTAVGPFKAEDAVPPDAITMETVEKMLVAPGAMQGIL